MLEQVLIALARQAAAASSRPAANASNGAVTVRSINDVLSSIRASGEVAYVAAATGAAGPAGVCNTAMGAG